MVTGRGDMVIASIARGHEREDATVNVGSAGAGELPADVTGHALNVIHHGDGVFENVVVDALKDIPAHPAILPVGDDDGVVDVAVRHRHGFNECPGELELLRDR